MAFVPLYRQISERILSDINSGKIIVFPTEAELIQKYQVSRVCIRAALQLLKDEHIIESHPGKKTVVTSNRPLKSNISSKKKEVIGIVMAGISDNYGFELLKSLQAYAFNLGYFVIVRFSNESSHDEANQIKQLINFGVTGLIIFPVEHYNGMPELLKNDLSEIPIVVLDRQLYNFNLPIVSTDNYRTVKTITAMLLKMNHKNITIIRQKHTDNSAMQARIQGISDAYKENNIHLKEDAWFYWDSPDINASNYYDVFSATVNKAKKRIIEKKKYSCYIALDFASSNVYQVAKSQIDLHNTRKISFLGFDGPLWLPSNNAYNRIVQDEQGIAHEALKLLDKYIKKKKTKKETILIEPKYLDNFSIYPNER